MNYEATVPCPQCQTPIPFEPRALISGIGFSCPKCQATIAISGPSRAVAKESLERLEALKKGR